MWSKCQSDYDVDVDVDDDHAHFGIFPFCHAPTGDIIMQKYPKMAIWPSEFFPYIHARSTDIIMAIIGQIGQIRPLSDIFQIIYSAFLSL